MRSYFRQVRILQLITFLTLIVLLIVLVFSVVGFSVWYENLPVSSEIRSRFQLGKFLTNFEVAHLFCDWRKLGIPVYDLTIGAKKVAKILQDLPPEGSLMTDEYKDFSKAQFFHNDKPYNAKVRIRGLSPNHWVDEKKSWRIKFDSNDLFEHRKSLDLIIPQDRGYFAEYLSNHIARKMGFWVPDDRFVFLRINGVLQGIYYEIEHPTGKFLELHRQVDRANFYKEESWDWGKYGFPEIFSDIGYWNKYSTETVSPFDNYSDLAYLLFLLNKADDSRFYKEIGHLINIDNFLSWQAHSLIMGSYHQSGHGNINMYFNIINGKFEFMPYDVGLFPLVTEEFIDKPYHPLAERILRNPAYLHRRNQILWRYINDEKNLKDDLQFYDNAYLKLKKAFFVDRKKGFTNRHFNNEVAGLRNIFLANRKKVISDLRFSGIFANIHLFTSDPAILSEIEMVSYGFSAAELTEAKISFNQQVDANMQTGLYLYHDSNNSGSFEDSDLPVAVLKPDASGEVLRSEKLSFLLYPDRDKNLQPEKRRYKFFLISPLAKPAGEPISGLEFTVNNAVTGENAQVKYRYVNERIFKDFYQISADREGFLLSHPIFKIDASGQDTVVLPAGEYAIEKNIIVPFGINLVIEPGARLRFHKGVSFLVYGRATLKGTRDKPIILTALNSNEPWGNFAVIGDAAKGSEFKYVIIEYASESFVNGIYFTGALSIHNTLAAVSDCIIRYNTGDDSVNVKSGECLIQDSVFYKNYSDGVDYDFSKGTARDNYIKDNGGDGLDLCRSDILVEGNRVEGSGDKGISVGELSKPFIINNLIRLCNIGIASKDASVPIIANNTIVENNSGVESYMKKPVFGGAKGIVRNTILWENKSEVTIDAVSTLDIDDSVVEGGYRGERIYDTEPVFANKKSGNYLLSMDEPNNKSIISNANLEFLNKITGYGEIKSVAIGILSSPKILSTSDFNAEN